MNRAYPVRPLFFAVICIAFLAMAGCGSGTGTLKGNVTFQGKPVVVGTVTVFASSGAVSLGDIQSDGTYEVRTIATGPATITVYSPDRTRLIGLERQALLERRASGSADAKANAADAKATADDVSPRVNPPGWMKLPDKYADVATTDLTTVVSGGTNSFDIALK